MSKNTPRGSKEEQQVIRQKAVEGVVLHNKSCQEMATLFGVALNTVRKWVNNYKKEGSSILVNKKRGRPKGSCSRLTETECKEIQKVLVDKYPNQLKMPFVLWTRKAIQELIENKFKKSLPLKTVSNYLKRWNFTPQRPAKSSYNQQPSKVRKWLDEDYPKIKKQAQAENAEIHWGDETGCTTDISNARSFSPKGKTPILKRVTKKKLKVNMLSSISNLGVVFFKLYENKINSQEFIEFMEKLIKCSDKKIYFIVDNLPQHHSKIVKDWVAENETQIKLFYLPSYSPELNPDEYLNGDLKQSMNKNRMPKTVAELKNNADRHMKGLEKNPDKIKSFFQHEKVKYAS